MAESKSLAALLAEAQAEMPNPKKDRQGQKGYQTYKYATLDSVVDIVKKPLNERGIFLCQPCERADDGSMRVRTVVMHGGETLVLDTKPYEYDTDPQEFGKRETYARRYSLLTAFGLAGEEDTDGDTGPAKRPAQKTAPKKQAARQKYLARIAALKTDCIQGGLANDELDSYLSAHYGTDDVTKLTDAQLIEYGKQLAATVDGLKEEQ